MTRGTHYPYSFTQSDFLPIRVGIGLPVYGYTP